MRTRTYMPSFSSGSALPVICVCSSHSCATRSEWQNVCYKLFDGLGAGGTLLYKLYSTVVLVAMTQPLTRSTSDRISSMSSMGGMQHGLSV